MPKPPQTIYSCTKCGAQPDNSDLRFALAGLRSAKAEILISKPETNSKL